MEPEEELEGLRRLLKAMKRPGFRLSRDGEDVTHEEIAGVELEIARLEEIISARRT